VNRSKNKKKQPFARKRFGQHFLNDRSIIDQIVTGAGVSAEDHVIEVGPGRGALTRPLLAQGALLTAVELDWDLVEGLKSKFEGQDRIQIVEGDILKIDWSTIIHSQKKSKIVANLPYNISTPIFFKFVTHRHQLGSIVIMVQKELAQRLYHTGEGSKLKDYGILSVVAANTFTVQKVCDVPASCFSPQPKVDSMVIRLLPKRVDIKEEGRFFEFVRRAFNNRRKLFVSFLKREHSALYEALPLPEREYLTGLRPENLLPEQYLRLFQGQPFLD
jgi:16S rRNA (adenine1518-N6/adenine1519-N6)-dimethyltransferase